MCNASPSNALSAISARLLLIILIISVIAPIIVITVIWPAALELDDTPLSDAAYGIGMYGLLSVFLYAALMRTGQKSQFSLGPVPPRQDVIRYVLLAIPLIGIAILSIYVVYFPLSFIWPELVVFWILESSPILWWRADLEAIIGSVINTLILTLIAPCLEEIFFRGFLLNRLMKKISKVGAVACSSLLFGLLHMDTLGAVIFGVILSMVYLHTRSLIGPIIIHIANNMIVFLVVLAEFIIYGEQQNWTLAQFHSYWWVAVVSALIGIPWLVWFWRKHLSGGGQIPQQAPAPQ